MNRTQPVCIGVNRKGELQWTSVPMELWQIIQQYRRQYIGDFGEQWMRTVIMERWGLGWDD